MRLNEFTDPRNYMLSTDDMAAILERIERIWCDCGIDADAPMILRIMDAPEDGSESIETHRLADG